MIDTVGVKERFVEHNFGVLTATGDDGTNRALCAPDCSTLTVDELAQGPCISVIWEAMLGLSPNTSGTG